MIPQPSDPSGGMMSLMVRIANGDLVVVLPGILGSTLQRDRRQTWGYRQIALNLHRLANRLTEDLSLPRAAFTDPAAGVDDGTVVTGVLTTQGIIPGFWTIDGYDELLFNLRTRFMDDQDVILAFPYDWRQSNEYTARHLQRWIEPLLVHRRITHPDARLILIGHSMGGLVARYYAECLDTRKLTRRVVTIGTPYLGAAKALPILANGYARLGSRKVLVGDLARSLPSVAELLPVYPCLGSSADQLTVLDAMSVVPGLPTEALTRCLTFHRQINDAIAANGDHRPAYHALLSHRQSTDTWASIDPTGETVAHQTEHFDDRGDGTVPRRSATPREWVDDASATYLAGKHAALQQQRETLTQLVGILTARPRRPQATQDEIAVDALPYVEPGADWSVDAYSVEGSDRLALTVTIVGTDTPAGDPPVAEKPLRPMRSGRYSATITLTTPGIFRWIVDTDPTAATHIDPVSDVLLCVAD
jgi:pimeloyl-ACP methyl ester carboxylesterase